MSQLTLFRKDVVAPVKVPAKVRPDAETIGDEILLDSAARIKTGRVSGGTSTTTNSRAWTMGGRVD